MKKRICFCIAALAALSPGSLPAGELYFPLEQMTGSAAEEKTINVRAVNNPVIYNGVYYYLPRNGTNFTTVNGFATNSFVPGAYTVSVAGLPKTWTIYVTNNSTIVNAVDLSREIVRYSGVQSITGSAIQVVNDGLGNITITDTNTSAGGGSGETNFLASVGTDTSLVADKAANTNRVKSLAVSGGMLGISSTATNVDINLTENAVRNSMLELGALFNNRSNATTLYGGLDVADGFLTVNNSAVFANNITSTGGFFIGNGSLLTLLNAGQLTGTLPDATFPATLPQRNGVNLTNLNFWNRRELVATNLPTDGTSSASQGLQDSINAVAALGGGTVVVPYIANGLTAKNVELLGNIRIRNHSTIKHGGSNPSGYTARTIGGAVEGDSIFWGTNAANIAIEGGTLLGTRPDGVWDGYTGNGEDALQFHRITNLLVRDVTITNAYQDGLELKECDGVMVENCQFRDISDAAIEARGSTNTFVRNSYFDRVYNAVMTKPMGVGGVSSEGLLVENCRIRSFHTALLLNVIRNCRIENNLVEISLLPIATGITNGALSTGIDIGEHPIFTAGLNVMSDISISRNRIIGRTNNPAIRILAGSTASLYNNRVSGNYVQNCRGAVIFYGGGIVSGNTASELSALDSNNPAFLVSCVYNPTNTAVLQNNITQGANTAQITIDSRGHAIGNVIGTIVVLTGSSNAVVKENIASRIVASTANNCQISGNRLESTSGTTGVIESVGNYNTIEGNSIWRGGSGSSVAALSVNGDGNTVCGNTVTNNHNQTVVQVTGGFRNVIMGNAIYNSTSSTSLRNQATDTVLSGNTIWGGNQLIRSVGTNAIIISNIGTNGLFQGLDLTSTSATNLVIGNRLHGLSSNYQDAGTRNQFHMNWNHSVGLYGVSTNATPPADTSTIKSWFNVTLPDGNIFKAALYQ